MENNQYPTSGFKRPPVIREDGWTIETQEDFIIALIDSGSVRAAAQTVDRHVTSAYRLRGRERAFVEAWDAARRMAYSRLRDEAMDRAINGTPQEVWKDGDWIGMKRVRNDRLLMSLLAHLKHEPSPFAISKPELDVIEDRRGDEIAARLDTLTLPPPPPEPVRLRPAKGRMVQAADTVDLQ